MGFFKKVFGGADGIRETIRDSYKKHRNAQGGSDAFSPHQKGLYGALASRYIAARTPRPEIEIWTELIPFLLMDEAEAVEALAEMVVYIEMTTDSRHAWLGERIRSAVGERLPAAPEYQRRGAVVALQQRIVDWVTFLHEAEEEVIRQSVPDGR